MNSWIQFSKAIYHHMWLHNELFCAVDDQPIMQFQNLWILCVFHFSIYSVKEMTIKCVMIGINIIIAEKFSLEVKCFFYFIPDLFTVQKVVICDPTLHTHKSITFLPRHTIFTISRAELMIYKGFISIMISNIEIILRHYLKL